jgi:O-antigen ligase/polysaccharide polymerase Wzy-like membrane protein
VLARTGAPVPLPRSIVIAAAIAGAALAGTAMAHSIQLGVAVAVALCYGPLVLLNFPLGVVLWIPFSSLIAVSALDVGPSVAGMLILFAWLGALAMRHSGLPWAVLQHRRLLGLVGALVLWVLLSMAWTERSPLGSDPFFAWLVAGAIMLVASTTLTDRRYVRLAVGAFVAGAVVSVAIGLLGGAGQTPSGSLGTATRVGGGSGDPNFLAAGIIPAIVLAAGLGAAAHRTSLRWTVVGAVVVLTVGFAATESRGGLIAAIVAAAAAVILAKHARAWVIALLLCVVGVALAWFSVEPEAWQRISDFHGSSGRDEVWRAAWQMWRDHPVVGVGLRGFGDHAADYLRELGPLKYAAFLSERPHVVHNSYLEMLVETGLVGFAMFLAVIAACLTCAWRAAERFEDVGDRAMSALARAVIVGVLAMLTAAFFISGSTDRRLWVLLAFGPALLAAARAEAASASDVGERRRRSGRLRRGPSRRLRGLHPPNAGPAPTRRRIL